MSLMVSVQWEIFRPLNYENCGAVRKLKKIACFMQNYVGDDIYCQQPSSKDTHVVQSLHRIKPHVCTSNGIIHFNKHTSVLHWCVHTLFPLPRILLTLFTFLLCKLWCVYHNPIHTLPLVWALLVFLGRIKLHLLTLT